MSCETWHLAQLKFSLTIWAALPLPFALPHPPRGAHGLLSIKPTSAMAQQALFSNVGGMLVGTAGRSMTTVLHNLTAVSGQ